MHRKLGRFGSDQLERFVHGHGLGAVDHALDRCEVSVLAGDWHLARQFLRGQGLDRTAGGGVVGGDDGVDLVVVTGQGVFDNAQGFGGVPFLDPLLADDLDIAFVDGRLQHLHLTFAQHLGVVVRRRAAEQEVIALGRRLQHAAGLHLADFFVIEGNIGVDVGIEDQAIIGHHLDPGLLGFGHRVGQHRGVERHNHDHIDAPGDEVFDLGNLLLFVGIGRLHEDLGVELFRSGNKVITVAGPALQAQVVDGKTDFGVRRIRHHRQGEQCQGCGEQGRFE